MAFVMQCVCGLTLVAVLCLSFLALLPALLVYLSAHQDYLVPHVLQLLSQGCAECTLACLCIDNAIDVVCKEACGACVQGWRGCSAPCVV
jgi:hypothetical protein